jgi:hypothetical protein
MILDKLNINGVQYTPAQYAIKVGFGITYNELVDWTKFHKDCNDFGEQRICSWIEDFFTEINYHEESQYLHTANYSKILTKGVI